MTGPVSWEMLTLVVGSSSITVGIILALVKWIYDDSSNRRTEITKLAIDFAKRDAEAREDFTNKLAIIREDIATKYVTTETHAIINKTLERAIDDLKSENRTAIDKLGDRIDHTLIALTEALKQKQ